MSAFLQNKRALIVGLASDRSIAWGIAQAMHRQGAEIALSYQNDRLASRVKDLGGSIGVEQFYPCDVQNDDQVKDMYAGIEQTWGNLDILVHAVAFGPREELKGNYASVTTREGFNMAHEISSYSLLSLSQGARQLMAGRDSAIVTLTYLGAERVMPSYNVMGLAKASLEANVRYLANALGEDGIRVNGISAGPIKTLAAAGIGNFKKFLDYAATVSPLKRNVSTDDVGNTAAFLCSDLALGVTGEILYVDAGFNVVGMPDPASM